MNASSFLSLVSTVPRPADAPDAPSKLPEHVEEIPVLTTVQLEDKRAKDGVTWQGERRFLESPIDEQAVVGFISRLS